MRQKKIYYLQVILIITLILTGGCTKNGGDTSSLYTPTSADVTANATLEQLQQGRALYIENCNNCHGLYNPDSNSPSRWRSILSNMAPKSGMSSSETQLVTKYLTRGN
jgi:mono/diheme cytochrome c family protein